MLKKIFTLSMLSIAVTRIFAQLWSPEQNLSAPVNHQQVSFTIGSVSYVYTGQASGNFFAYNPSANSWSAMADFPAGARTGSTGFSIGSNGYLGLGKNGSAMNDFYSYNPSGNTWTAVANYPDSIYNAGGFNIGNYGYVAGGIISGQTLYSDSCYQYDPAGNTWTAMANMPVQWAAPFCCSTATNGYVCFGYTRNDASLSYSNELYAFDPVGNTWAWENSCPTTFGNPELNFTPQGFVIGGTIYIADEDSNTMRIFNPTGNSWSQASLFPLNAASQGGFVNAGNDFFAFTNDGYGYLNGNGAFGFYFWQYNPSLNFTLNSVSPDTFCTGEPISFTFSSNVTFASDNRFYLSFSFEDGEYLGIPPTASDSVSGFSAGTYTVHVPYDPTNNLMPGSETAILSVASTDPPSLTQYSQQIYIKSTPLINLYHTNQSYCIGDSVILELNVQSSGVQRGFWSTQAGTLDSTSLTRGDFVVRPTSTTVYYFNETTMSTGCRAIDSIGVNVGASPNPGLPNTSYAICPSANLLIGGTSVGGYSYQWSDGNGFTSSLAQPSVSPTVNDVYSLTVTSDTTSCSATFSVNVTTKQPPTQTICLVTADSASDANIVVWEKLDRDATDSFFIYREVTTNSYEKVGAVAADSLSQFEDDGADPGITSFQYKISALDTCGNESPMSPYHNTIHLVYQQGGQLSWNAYQIEDDSTTPVASFVVLKDSLGNGNWQPFITVPGNQYAVTDVYFASNPNAQYRVSANFSYTCTPTRSYTAVLSNTVSQSPASVQSLGDSHFNIYPNPATTLLHITYKGAQPEWITVYNVNGQVVRSEKYTSPVMQIADYIPGIYVIELRTNNQVVNLKFVKM
jgi:hypothetical protein